MSGSDSSDANSNNSFDKVIQPWISDTETPWSDLEADDLGILEAKVRMQKIQCLTGNDEYFYNELYLQEEGSDIAIEIFGETWNLHKIILKQSPYFAKMFSGSWKEATEKCIQINIVDLRITRESIDQVLGSLYHGSIVVGASNVESIVATASLFELKELMGECEDVMRKTTNYDSIMSYYIAADAYGLQSAKLATKEWLETNMSRKSALLSYFLNKITPDLMAEIIKSPNFYVSHRGGFRFYRNVLRPWVYFFEEDVTADEIDYVKVDNFHKIYCQQNAVPLVLTEKGAKYREVFDSLRLKYMLTDPDCIKTLKDDNIIPHERIDAALKDLWNSILLINNSNEISGPSLESVTPERFEESCLRICSVFPNEDYSYEDKIAWCRRLKFLYNLVDVEFSIEGDDLVIRAYNDMEAKIRFIDRNFTQHKILIKVCLTLVNMQGQVSHRQTSELQSISLSDDKVHLLTLDETWRPAYGSQMKNIFLSVKVLDVEVP